ncbi:hypothetical protein KIL84_012774 [Mauremys mutica]|uniref:Uncharacterized protein n=1 Tax=Mauremys mutica TaxID=74926 RepID=A0A9D3XRN0_9SAUR|nr:hypothetical protein KIL84_012774 [Mauremys mutica]
MCSRECAAILGFLLMMLTTRFDFYSSFYLRIPKCITSRSGLAPVRMEGNIFASFYQGVQQIFLEVIGLFWVPVSKSRLWCGHPKPAAVFKNLGVKIAYQVSSRAGNSLNPESLTLVC